MSTRLKVAFITFFVVIYVVLPIYFGAKVLPKAVDLWRNSMLERALDIEFGSGKLGP